MSSNLDGYNANKTWILTRITFIAYKQNRKIDDAKFSTSDKIVYSKNNTKKDLSELRSTNCNVTLMTWQRLKKKVREKFQYNANHNDVRWMSNQSPKFINLRQQTHKKLEIYHVVTRS